MAENLKKAKDGYNYKYTELAQINEYLGSIGVDYYQYIMTENEADYIYTVPIIEGKELPPRRGCKIIEPPLSGKSNAAQQQGAAITYARRYSLLLAFGLATEDDDAQSLNTAPKAQKEPEMSPEEKEAMIKVRKEMFAVMNQHGVSTDEVMKVYNLKKIDAMSISAMQNAIKNIDKIKAKAEEMKK